MTGGMNRHTHFQTRETKSELENNQSEQDLVDVLPRVWQWSRATLNSIKYRKGSFVRCGLGFS